MWTTITLQEFDEIYCGAVSMDLELENESVDFRVLTWSREEGGVPVLRKTVQDNYDEEDDYPPTVTYYKYEETPATKNTALQRLGHLIYTHVGVSYTLKVIGQPHNFVVYYYHDHYGHSKSKHILGRTTAFHMLTTSNDLEGVLKSSLSLIEQYEGGGIMIEDRVQYIGQIRECRQGVYQVVAYEDGKFLVEYLDEEDYLYEYSPHTVLTDKLLQEK